MFRNLITAHSAADSSPRTDRSRPRARKSHRACPALNGSGVDVAYDWTNGSLNEFTPNEGWVAISSASQIVQGGNLDVFFLSSGSSLFRGTGVPSATSGQGYVNVATGVTKLASDQAGEVVVLEGTHT